MSQLKKKSDLVKSYLKSIGKDISDLVDEMDIKSRNTFYYHLKKIDKNEYDTGFFDKFKNATGTDLMSLIKVDTNELNISTITPRLSEKGKGVPYYDVDFIGGFDLVMNDQVVQPSYYIDFLPFNDVDCWLNVTGKSMGPLIAHGDIVALKKLNEWKNFLLFGEIYAIVTPEYRTIKILGKGHDNDHFRLIPYNKSDEYDEQPIPKSIITHIFRVKGALKKFF